MTSRGFVNSKKIDYETYMYLCYKLTQAESTITYCNITHQTFSLVHVHDWFQDTIWRIIPLLSLRNIQGNISQLLDPANGTLCQFCHIQYYMRKENPVLTSFCLSSDSLFPSCTSLTASQISTTNNQSHVWINQSWLSLSKYIYWCPSLP